MVYSTRRFVTANSSNTEAPFLNLNLCNGTVSNKIYDKREFDIVICLCFWMAISHMGCTYVNLLNLPELLQTLVTLTAVLKPLLSNFLGRAIVILNFERHFRKFTADTVPWQKNIGALVRHL